MWQRFPSVRFEWGYGGREIHKSLGSTGSTWVGFVVDIGVVWRGADGLGWQAFILTD